MRFLVSRTSCWDDRTPPCEEAKRVPYIYIDERNEDDPKKIRGHEGEEDWWYGYGRNHRVEHGHIKRDFEEVDWFIEIDTLEQFMAFSIKYERLVIQPNYYSHETNLEIYDDYRE